MVYHGVFWTVVLYFSVTLEPGSWLVARLSCIRTPEDIYIQPVKMVRSIGVFSDYKLIHPFKMLFSAATN